jgi:hypothetical protein
LYILSKLLVVLFLQFKLIYYRYALANKYSLSDIGCGTQTAEELNQIQSISINPSETKMLITTKRNTLYSVDLFIEQDFKEVCNSIESAI